MAEQHPPPTGGGGKRGFPTDDWAYDDDGERVEKRRCVEPKDNSATTIDIFVFGPVASTVFSFLTLRELLLVSSTAKSLRAHLRHEHVVRSALLHGSSAKTSMEKLVRLIRERQIWTPSPLRMLRLVNGKRCERCNYPNILSVSSDFGLFLCRCNCLVKPLTQPVSKTHACAKFLDHPRAAFTLGSSGSRSVFADANFQDATGNLCGPFLTLPHLEQLLQHQTTGTTNTTMDQLLETLDARDEYACHAAAIVQIFDETQRDANRLEKERKEKKKSASDVILAKKREKIRDMVEQLKGELGEQAALPWNKDAILQYRDNYALCLRGNRLERSHQVKSCPVKFRFDFVDNLMKDYVLAPSKATKKKRIELKDALLETMGVIFRTKFHNFSFLSVSIPMESALRTGFSRAYPRGRHLALVNESTLTKLRNGEVLAALETLGGYDVIARSLAPIIASTVYRGAHRHRAAVVGLATRLFRSLRYKQKDVRARFQFCMNNFPGLFRQVRDFWNSPEVQTWKAQKEQEGFTRQQIRQIMVEAVWSPDSRGGVDLIENVSKRDYTTLLEQIAHLF